MIVIDTHVLVWWATGSLDKLSNSARRHLNKGSKTDGGILVSAISAWEIALLASKRRLGFTMSVEEWLTDVETLPGVRFCPIDRALAVASVHLPEPFTSDPADRLIVALARSTSFPLVTKDRRIHDYGHVHAVW